MDLDVLCIGASSWDLCFTLPGSPQSDAKIVAERFLTCGGGPAANAAVALSKLGYRTAFAGYLGSDDFGIRHMRELRTAGVCTDFVARGETPTPVSSALISPDGRRMLVNYTPPRDKLQPQDFDFSELRCKIILCDGHEPDLALALIRQNRERSVKSILDAGSLHRGTKMLMHEVDFLVCSEKFACEYSGTNDMKKALRKFSSDIENIVITLGGKGLIWRNNDGTGRMAAFSIKAIDTTGAGDAFHAAFAAGLIEEFKWADLLRFASATAALCCTKLAARPGMPAKSTVLKLMREQAMPITHSPADKIVIE